jgi:hypothetical protein
MQDVHMELNPGFPWQKQHSTGRKLFHQQIGLKLEEEVGKVLRMKHSFVSRCNLDT